MALTDTVLHDTTRPARLSIDSALRITPCREASVAHCIPGAGELLLLAKVAANVMQQWMIKNDQWHDAGGEDPAVEAMLFRYKQIIKKPRNLKPHPKP